MTIDLKKYQIGDNPKWHHKCGNYNTSTCSNVGGLQLYSNTCKSSFVNKQPLCVLPDTNVCPRFSNSQGTNTGFINTVNKTINGVPHNPVNCRYNTKDIIRTNDDFDTYINNFNDLNSNDVNYYTPIMDFCLENLNSCNINSYLNKKPTSCPRILGTTQGGNKCRMFFNNNINNNIFNSTWKNNIQEYCNSSENKNKPACYCLSANWNKENPYYEAFNLMEENNETQQADTNCWFYTCRPTSSLTLDDILLPSENFNTSNCPKIDCATYNNLYNSNLDNSIIKSASNCTKITNKTSNSINPNYDTSTINNLNSNKSTELSNNLNNSDNNNNIKKTLNKKIFNNSISIFLLLIILLVIIFFVIIISYKYKKSHSKKKIILK